MANTSYQNKKEVSRGEEERKENKLFKMERKPGKISINDIENYPEYLATPPAGNILIERLIARDIIKFLRSNKMKVPIKILDAGCGIGLWTSYLYKLAKKKKLETEIVGVDILPSMIACAKERAEKEGMRITFLEEDMTNLSFLDNSFDFVMSVFVFFLLDEKEIVAFLREMYRVLKPGGRFYFFHPNRNKIAQFFVYLITRDKKQYEIDVIRHGYSPNEMSALMKKNVCPGTHFTVHKSWGGLATKVTGYVEK